MEQGQKGFHTSHVTVQRLEPQRMIKKGLFPYIPCYCSTRTNFFYLINNFMFPYIPCYCSTEYILQCEIVLVEFPYIPCYCSTYKCQNNHRSNRRFHTSHVTVQRPVTVRYKNPAVSFHTSHVTVQPKPVVGLTATVGRFPYIPCYCSTVIVFVSFSIFGLFPYIPCYCST